MNLLQRNMVETRKDHRGHHRNEAALKNVDGVKSMILIATAHLYQTLQTQVVGLLEEEKRRRDVCG